MKSKKLKNQNKKIIVIFLFLLTIKKRK